LSLSNAVLVVYNDGDVILSWLKLLLWFIDRAF